MLSRIVLRSLTRRRRKLLSLAAVTLGISVATAVATLALDVGDKVGRELRSFGANLTVTPAAETLPLALGGAEPAAVSSGALLDEENLAKLKRIFWKHNILGFAPFLDLRARAAGRDVTLVGTWFSKTIQVEKNETFRTGVRELYPAWQVVGAWPDDSDESGALVGRRAAEATRAEPGVTFDVALARDPATQISLTVRGVLETGGPEEELVYIPLVAAQRLAGVEGKIRRIKISALTKPEDDFARADVTRMTPEEFDRWYCTPYISSIAYQIEQVIPGSEARPVFRIAETEGAILSRVAVVMATLAAAALVTAALAVASMMLAAVLERRTEIGLLKSLGATDARVAALFLLEAGAIGALGGVAGYFAGTVLAQRLGHVVFGLPVETHWILLPIAVAMALAVTLAGSAWPLARGLRLSPSAVLHGE
jgi:putative ABC transport system permease protein